MVVLIYIFQLPLHRPELSCKWQSIKTSHFGGKEYNSTGVTQVSYMVSLQQKKKVPNAETLATTYISLCPWVYNYYI